ncbi:hypothetical protein GUITHDRAFT_139055 [Guillardia theta CCMP2712]|uniref:CRAL-TRIO domain-containing protein n=1 Tax=Guillardia theta (strain CCMP2712) TaxID=905079 RepID=L1JBN5_GUITC|nr:hypothetical protein GUITHDRAFT_139055 [Guillardia theta CCMP2712]EKX45500.1 hypothetical protein GUITHDRAFT_139055 [Guillardia theta CCMP2712]|eukprot:XP_005832480.1 hypothetical protein GUITHDRAFT_139055 [Guillardia theta CCMP2712]
MSTAVIRMEGLPLKQFDGNTMCSDVSAVNVSIFGKTNTSEGFQEFSRTRSKSLPPERFLDAENRGYDKETTSVVCLLSSPATDELVHGLPIDAEIDLLENSLDMDYMVEDSLSPSNVDELVVRLRNFLSKEGFKDNEKVLSTAYLRSVLSGTKDGKQRTFEYVAQKILKSLRWRVENGAASISFEDVSRSLAPNHMFWSGYDKFGRPILYARPALMDLKTYDRDEYIRAHVYLIERGIQMMEKALLNVATEAYPDRLGMLLVGPVNLFVRAAWSILSKLIPKRLAKKIHMSKDLT